MPVPTYEQLLQPTYNALHALGGSASVVDIHKHVLQQLNLPEEVANQPHPGSNLTELSYRLHWARTYLKKYGLIVNPTRGTWSLTEMGRATPEISPDEICSTVNAQLHQRRQAKTDGAVDPNHHDLAPSVTEHSLTITHVVSKRPVSVDGSRSPTPHFPTYDNARYFLKSLDGVSYQLYRDTVDTIWAQRGNPQEQTNWADPDAWIPERLSGPVQDLARRIWEESTGQLNPRYLSGCWTLCVRHNLLARDIEDVLRITARGRQFLEESAGILPAEIDEYEGVFVILGLVAEKGPGKRGDFLPEYSDYCRTFTTWHSDTAIYGALYNRLSNLIDRGYVVRRGQSYEITDAGLAYLDRYAHIRSDSARPSSRQSDIRKIAKDMRDEARTRLGEFLSQMDPFKFEELIKLLLEEMGYDDVNTTAPTNDKGIDVVANIELGISSVREVIQAKRHKGTIGRAVLDQLRGSLYRFNAVRGTIITTGRFSKGAQESAFERGAPPITLIDGAKLLDLLMEHQIGVAKRSVEYYEFDPTRLTQFQMEEEAS